MHYSDHDIHSFFDKANVDHELTQTQVNGQNARYVRGFLDSFESKPLLVFVHGAPGSWDAYKDYMTDSTLLKKYDIISVDRLGYSGSYNDDSVLSIEAQSSLVKKVIDDNPTRDIVLVGHSYGGPVAACASIGDSRVKHLVLLAPVNDPVSEPIFWFAKMLNWKALKWIMPAFIQVSVEEKISHPRQLREVENMWAQITVPVDHLHSKNDWIAPGIENIEFTKKNINSDLLVFHDRGDKGHLIPFNDVDYVKSLLLSY